MGFNPGQLLAITTTNKHILVSAPAGSGKTAVLVERIFRQLCEGNDVDSLLVLTFTEAAGNEMKQRLLGKLNEAIEKGELSQEIITHLKTQKAKLPNAYITNFHGFCSTLLKKYGYMIGIQPGFEILSDNKPYKLAALKQCEAQWFKDENFTAFLRTYFPGFYLDKFEEVLLSLESLSHTISDFEDFSKNQYELFYKTLDNGVSNWPLFDSLKQILIEELFLSKEKLADVIHFCQTHNLEMYYERPEEQSDTMSKRAVPSESMLEYIDLMIASIQSAISYDSLKATLSLKPEPAYTMSWKEVDPDIKKEFTSKKDAVLKAFNSACTNYINDSEEEFIEKVKEGYKPISYLFTLLNEVNKTYSTLKTFSNYLDFNDLEHYASLLLDEDEVISKLSTRLNEIMIDEYQDTNQIQENLVQKIVQHADDHHIYTFMVGDMKQSIYRFRQADPSIFKGKYTDFIKEENTNSQRVDLCFNYRSCKVVLDSINYIFDRIMDFRYGGLEYYQDDSAQLNYDYLAKEKDIASCRKHFISDDTLATEILLNVQSEDSTYKKPEEEAHMVAQRIKQLIGTQVNNKIVDYKDIAILMRNTKEFLTFKKVFDLYQIPNHIVLSSGLLESIEFNDLFMMLKALDDPTNDLAMMNIISRPYAFSNISLNTIAKCRINHKKESLYTTLCESSDPSIMAFMKTFEYLRNFAFTHSPYETLMLLEETSKYPLFVSQLYNGEQRKANIELFNELVKSQQSKYPYLSDIITYFESASDKAPAPIASDDNNLVEFMTIHKSKGLEFPIVFVCMNQKKFNFQDSNTRILYDKDYGFASDPRKVSKGHVVKYDNPYKKLIARKVKDEAINEEMRIFYVALTRAVDKLILTASIDDLSRLSNIQNKLITNMSELDPIDSDHMILANSIRKVDNYLDWILSSTLAHPDIIKQCASIEGLSDNVRILQNLYPTPNKDNMEHARFHLSLKSTDDIEALMVKRSHDLSIMIEDQNHYDTYVYPYDLTKSSSIAVTTLQKMHDEQTGVQGYQTKYQDDHFDYLNLDENSLNVSATEKGTLVHLLLSELHFDNNDNIDSAIEQLVDNGLCDKTHAIILKEYQSHLDDFVSSDTYKEICSSDHIFKEKPFTTYDNSLHQQVNGIFDLVYIKDNRIYVLDYKTDRVKQDADDAFLIQQHEVQLEYYKKILHEAYQLDVTAILYYLHINKEVRF